MSSFVSISSILPLHIVINNDDIMMLDMIPIIMIDVMIVANPPNEIVVIDIVDYGVCLWDYY